MKKISIIIPVYNALPYLHECIKSMFSQTFENWEAIFVDDLSTDDSYNQLLEYAKKDNRIKVFQLEKNSGSGPARNFALDQVSGDYILFMDSDDFYYKDNIIEKLYNAIDKNNCDMAGGNMQDLFDGVYKPTIQGVFDKEGIISNTDYPNCSEYTRFIYSAKIINENNIRFPNYRRYQDPVFFAEVLCHVKKIYMIKDIVYTHRKDHKKVNWDKEKIDGLIKAYRDCINFCKKSNRKLALNTYHYQRIPYEIYNTILPYCIKSKRIEPLISFYKISGLSVSKFMYVIIKRLMLKIVKKIKNV